MRRFRSRDSEGSSRRRPESAPLYKPVSHNDVYFERKIRIMVITGPPCCNKTALGRAIATRLGCPSLFLEAIVDALLSNRLVKEANTKHQHEDHELLGAAFDILINQASYLVPTAKNLSRPCVVLEFPLISSNSEVFLSMMDKLVQKILSDHDFNVVDRFLIVECVPQDSFMWRNHYVIKSNRRWHQVDADWADMVQRRGRLQLKLHRAISVRGSLISLLEVDPFIDFYANYSLGLPFQLGDDVTSVSPALYEALEYILFNPGGFGTSKGPQCISMRQWGEMRHDLLHLKRSHSSSSAPCLKGDVPHDIIYTSISTAPDCEICGRTIDPGTSGYSCTFCPLDFHRSCAELDGVSLDSLFLSWVGKNIQVSDRGDRRSSNNDEEKIMRFISNFHLSLQQSRPDNPSENGSRLDEINDNISDLSSPRSVDWNKLLLDSLQVDNGDNDDEDYLTHLDASLQRSMEGRSSDTCKSCKLERKSEAYSERCLSCKFMSVLKSRELPMIIRHPARDQDVLQLQLLPSRNCAACGENIEYDFAYYDKRQNLFYGVSCIGTALRLATNMHKHFGYLHPLQLKFSPNEAYEDHICHACCKERNPRHWYYYCEQCDYEAHLYCILTTPKTHTPIFYT